MIKKEYCKKISTYHGFFKSVYGISFIVLSCLFFIVPTVLYDSLTLSRKSTHRTGELRSADPCSGSPRTSPDSCSEPMLSVPPTSYIVPLGLNH